MRNPRLAPAILGLALSLAGLAANAQPQAAPATKCFLSRDWSGWKGSPDLKSIYIRVRGRSIYRLDLSAPCTGVDSGFSHLVTRNRGGSWICNPLDLDLSVSDGHGFRSRCIVSKITPLSTEEAASLPKSLRP
jgi:hypothetical protein